MFGGNFPPRGWALCNGQILPISQNTALFSLLGTTYGGNGTSTFALPNLQSQLPVHFGQGNGLSPYVLGETGGVASITINQTTMPTHSHLFNVTTANASAAAIASNLLPATPTVANAAFYATPGSPALQGQLLAAGSCGNAGSGQAHSNLMPTLCITFIIALEGIFPARN
ncbi:MAG TPA: tail fiber protein [Pseudolabrys sp.]